MAGRAAFAIRQQQSACCARVSGLCKSRACPQRMTHVTKLGKNRGRVPHMLYVGPACPRVLLMGKKIQLP